MKTTEQTHRNLAFLVSQGFTNTIIERFFAKVEELPNGCWIWKGKIGHQGYGVINRNTFQTEASHRVSWMIHNAAIPDGQFVVHKCLNKACVNPDHLLTATRNPNAKTRQPSDPFPRFIENVVQNPDTYCWEWIGKLNYNGYGKFFGLGKHMAHQFSYLIYIGPIEPGFEIHHRCRNRRCVNPFHLQSVTHQFNCATDFKRDMCPNGHPLTPENCYEYIRDGRSHRTCKLCAISRSKARYLANT